MKSRVESAAQPDSAAGSNSASGLCRAGSRGSELARPGNWSAATYRSIARCLLGREIIHGRELGSCEQSLREMFQAPAVLLCGSGSMALEFALRALGVGGGDDVVIPAFCCTAIVRPIIATGAAPVFADVGVDLNLTAASVEAALTAKTRAVVVPHLFGQPADIRAIAELARGRNIRVVDDAAQALGASTAEKLAGAFGDAGVISFGAQKVCSGIGGGALIFSSGEAAARAQATRLRPASRALVLQLLLARIIAEQRWRSVLGRASFWFRHAPDTFPARYRHQSMANLQAAVARSLLESLPENLAARRVRVRLYRDVLGQDKRLELLPHAAGSACLVQIARVLPLRHGDDLAARVIALAGEAGYEVRGSYIPIHLLPGFQGHQRRRPAYAERIWGELVELPCGPEIGPGNIEHIAAIVQKAISF